MSRSAASIVSLSLVFALSGCDDDEGTAFYSYQTMSAPQRLGDGDLNTEHTFTTNPDGSVTFNVDTSESTPSNIPGIGEHSGELDWLEVTIVFKDPYFYTPEGYAGYYIGLPMNYEVRLRNTGPRTYQHLDVFGIQEYYETGTCDRWWYPYPREADYTKGEPLPGDSTQSWTDVELGAGQELVLSGTYTAPISTCSGLDQMHLVIQHTSDGAPHAATMYYNPEAAIYCPPPPDK